MRSALRHSPHMLKQQDRRRGRRYGFAYFKLCFEKNVCLYPATVACRMQCADGRESSYSQKRRLHSHHCTVGCQLCAARNALGILLLDE